MTHSEEASIEKALTLFCNEWYGGNKIDPEEFCKSYPQFEAELRTRIEDFLFVAQAMPMSRSRVRKKLTQDQIIGDFRIIRELGRGGMGVVYEAEQLSLSRRVALKILPMHLSLSESSVKKFRREAEAGSRHAHPGLVAVFAVGQADEVHYIAQELVDKGYTLEDRLLELHQVKTFPDGYFIKAAKFMAQVADALHHTHTNGVIHRDLKPSNILIAKDGKPKVTDFGLARIEDVLAASRSSDFAGTPFYMSPEQIDPVEGQPVDHRTDIFSLGVTLYEMITLSQPFGGKTSHDVLRKVISVEPANPRTLDPQIPKDLAVICLKSIEKKPADRYATMSDFAADLRRFINGDPILARPAGLVTRVVKKIKRNPSMTLVVSVALVVILSLLVSTGLEKYAIKVIEEKEQRAVQKFLSSKSISMLDQDPALSWLLGIKSSGPLPNPQANNAIIKAMAACYLHKAYPWITRAVCADFSIHKEYFMAGGHDGVLRQVCVKTGRILREVKAHTLAIRSVAFSPDGTMLATASEDMLAKVWLLDSFTLVSEFKHFGTVSCLDFCNNNTRLLTGAEDAQARLWDISANKLVRSFKMNAWSVNSVVPITGSDRVLIASDDKTVRLWDTRTDTAKLVVSMDFPVKYAEINGDGKSVLLITDDHMVRIWDLAEKRFLWEHPHLFSVKAAGFIPETDKVFTVSQDRVIRIFRPSTKEVIDEIRGFTGDILFAKLSSQGRIITVSHDHAVRLHNLVSGLGFNLFNTRKKGKLYDFSSDLKWMATGDCDSKCFLVKIWNVEKGEVYQKFKAKKTSDSDQFRSLKFSRRGNKLAAVFTGPNRVVMWDIHTREETYPIAGSPHGDLYSVDFDSNDEKLIGVFNEAAVVRADLETGMEGDFLKNPNGFYAGQYAKDGDDIFTITKDGSFQIWAAGSGDPKQTINERKEGKIIKGDLNRDGSLALTLSQEGQLSLWDSRTKELIYSYYDPCGIRDASFDLNGDRVIVYFKDGRVLVKEALKDRAVIKPEELSSHIKKLVFDENNEWILTITDKRCVQVRHQNTCDVFVELEHSTPVEFAQFTEDSKAVITLSKEGIVRKWPLIRELAQLADTLKPRDWTLEEKREFDIWEDDEEELYDQLEDRIVNNRKKARILDFLNNAEHLPKKMRWEAERHVEASFEDPYNHYKKCWEMVWMPNQTLLAYDIGLSHIKQALEEDPENPLYLQALGVTLFRNQKYEEAKNTLENLLDKPGPDGGRVAVRAIYAMACYKLNLVDKALKHHKVLRGYIMDPWEGRFNSSVSFVDEADGLISEPEPMGAPTETPPPFLYVFKTKGEGKDTYSLNYCNPATNDSVKNIWRGKDVSLCQCAASPDGKWFYYLENKDAYRICRFDLASAVHGNAIGHEIVLEHNEPLGCFDFSPDGKKLYFEIAHMVNDTNWQPMIYRACAQGPKNQSIHLVMGGPDQVFRMFRISPQGDRICFLHFEGKNNVYDHEVWLADLIGEGESIINPRRLTVNSLNDMFPKFSKDGKVLYWANVPETGSCKNPEVRYYKRSLVNLKKERIFKNLDLTKLNPKKTFDRSVNGLFLFVAKAGDTESLVVVSPSGEELYRTKPADAICRYFFLPQQ